MSKLFNWKAPVLACAAFATAARAEVTLTQNINLSIGWNAVYIEVSPTQPLDEVFADWPVDKVGFYDPASFLATRQFGDGAKALSMKPVATWFRNYPEASDTERIPAGSVALAFNTNDAPTAVSVTGVPAAPRLTWHVTDTNEVLNFVGFSLQSGAKVLPTDYLEGFDGDFSKGLLYRIGGGYDTESPTISAIYSNRKVSDGDVLLVASAAQSDWSGALFVSPMNGIDFGTDGVRATLSIRNDGGAPRTVALALMHAQNVGRPYGSWGAIELPDAAVKMRDAAVALTNAAWNAIEPAASTRVFATKTLGVDETWKLDFGLDRSALPAAEKGAVFGALLRVTDVDGISRMRVDVPFVGASSGTDTAATAWPGGLWVADVAFSRIRPPGATVETETGGAAKVRLPLHVAGDGTIRLLQRVVAAGETAADGTYTYRLYAGSATVPTTATAVMRISSVVLPTELPVIEANAGATLAAGNATFSFTVAGDGATSLLRHPLHPQHDGLRWDFSTKTPSGDDFANYKGDVKPETFSVSCRIELSLDFDGGEAAWNPENAKSGTCRWTFSNLMRQGDISLSGPMTLKRVSPLSELVLE